MDKNKLGKILKKDLITEKELKKLEECKELKIKYMRELFRSNQYFIEVTEGKKTHSMIVSGRG